MKVTCAALLTALFAATLPAVAAPVIPGLHPKHPLSEPQVGELLLGELRCMACHTRKGAPAALERAAPDLSDVGFRVAPDALSKFIASPSESHRGTLMPDVLLAKPADERNAVAEALAHYLVSRSPRKFESGAVPEKEAATGRALFHSVGCIACHSPRDERGEEEIKEGVVELKHVPGKYSPASLEEFLFQPTRVRPSGRMPDMKLTPAEARSVAAYLIGTAPESKPLQPREDLAAKGKAYFQELNCAACHQIDGMVAAKPDKELNGADLMSGCLSETPGKGPRFHPNETQRKAIAAALAKPEPATDKSLLQATLTAFNCIACHSRDDFGGVAEERNPHFQTSAKNLGEEARIPPPLTGVGAKLQSAWLKKVLFDGESSRPYMATRMPQYGEPNLRHLPELLAKVDPALKDPFHLPDGENGGAKERERAKLMREAGKELLGDKGLACVVCHNFNGKKSAHDGIDLILSFQRLRPEWFARYMKDPAAYYPRTVMPTSWPGGKAVLKTVLDGDTDRQLEAIWYFLSLGTSAPTPSGLQPVETKLYVTDATRTYRGRSSVAGYRGIAVGFPEKLSYAFNAETGALSAIWRGDFIRVDRSGQGSGGFNPIGKIIPLPQDLAFYALPDEKTPWPLRPVTTKEDPVGPDPLYPKNRGYRFKGYYLDDASVPTFQYRSGDIEIEDHSIVAKNRLVRELRFDSPTETTLWFRAMTGKIESESKQRFKLPELRLEIPPVPTLLRPIEGGNNASELLLRLTIPQGKSKLSFTYEPLP